MDLRVISALAFSTLSVALGFVLRSSTPAAGGGGGVFIALGLSIGASMLALLLARMLGFGKPAAELDPVANERLETLISQLLAAAELARTKGLLALTQTTVPAAPELYHHGAELVLAAREAPTIRHILAGSTDVRAAHERVSVLHKVLLGRLAYTFVLVAAIAVMIWQVTKHPSTASIEGLGSLGAVGLFVGVYGAFIWGVLIESWADQKLGPAYAAEEALKATLVTEALLGIQASEHLDALGQRLRRLCGPSGENPHTRTAASKHAA